MAQEKEQERRTKNRRDNIATPSSAIRPRAKEKSSTKKRQKNNWRGSCHDLNSLYDEMLVQCVETIIQVFTAD
ncbi:hypothetical protein LguiA_035579 [Lonicera macranthoides]